MSDITLQAYSVWDLRTRWFHWINFGCVVVLAALGTALLFDEQLGVTDRNLVASGDDKQATTVSWRRVEQLRQ
jgi:streptomycin 6-kinase